MNSTAPIIATFTTRMMGSNLFALKRGAATTAGAGSSVCAIAILQQVVQQAACLSSGNDPAGFCVSGH
jgi:uncharacterized membrane protein YadS